MSVAVTGALALAAVGIVGGPTSPASAKTIKACYQKKTGEMVYLKKGKCKKGWKKVTWNKAGVPGAVGPTGTPGAPGAQGPAGPQLSVKDKNGTVLGSFMGFYNYGTIPTFMVGHQGGLYAYDMDGRLQEAGNVRFTDSGCSSPVLNTDSLDAPMYLATVGGAGRAVERATTPTYGPARAWALTNSVTNVPANTSLWYLDNSGSCVLYTNTFTGVLIAWSPVAAPPDGVGPLAVG